MATADWDRLRENFISVMNNQTVMRSLDAIWAQEMINSIDSYGCWCYFQEDHGKGRGPPANEVDAQCKMLHDGYECIILDALDEGDDDCVPWDEKYNSGTGLGLVATDPENNNNGRALRKSCQRSNRNSKCAQRTCIVEGFFVMQIFKHFLAGVQFDPSLKHSLGVWDRIEDCPIKSGVDTEKECCGTYPHRFPFKLATLGGARNCCGENTYNPDVMECCPGNVAKIQC